MCTAVVLLVAATALAESSRYERIVQALESAGPELRASFARSALLELTEVYLAEADLARAEARDSAEANRLMSWSRAVERYAAQLALVLDDIAFGYPVALRRYPREVASVSVAGRTIMLAHPRRQQQAVYEQSVLAHFCGQGRCRELLAPGDQQAAIPMSAGRVAPTWEFTAAGPRCSHQALQLAFSAAVDLGRQRALCQQLMAEAELLATELAWQQRHGVAIDWQALAVRAVPRRPEHLVLLNSAGDSLLATLPLVHGSAGLLQQLVPWLRQRFSGEQAPAPVILQASVLGWE
ncbi:hypothetical protein DWB85_08705 [Seongchinamella sediminis]|uniref:Uncharacterized protein n=1 Tax=Seongchinamella sediminis TaxID=2283635 RepID=A0A3L7DYQ5_9GAMM|nr:hypothetical protein [Seongchinamella sediminis]RLQ22346.1 hypothetical protein DWB85_08705 [Seongchinamella sediminis]